MEQKKNEQTKKYVVGRVPTEYQNVIVNTENEDEVFDLLTAICEIKNDIDEIKKALIGK